MPFIFMTYFPKKKSLLNIEPYDFLHLQALSFKI